MSAARETEIIRAFVDLSNELVDDYDVVDMLATLTTNCASLLDISSAGLLLADDKGVLHLAASSSESSHDLEMFQLQRAEGPCLDCYHGSEPILVPDLDAEQERWPQFCRAAGEVGIKSVHALPIRLKTNVLGTIGLFGKHTGSLGDDDFALAQALVHVASVAIVNERSATDTATINAHLEHALQSRVLIEQAKGVLAQAGGLEMSDAFAVLRRYSRDHSRKISDVAGEIVHRHLPYEDPLKHARAVAMLP